MKSLDHPFEQTVIAIIWDFDKTLINGYMQEPIFQHYGVEGKRFWEEVNGLAEAYKKQDIRINKDTIYLNHFLTCVKQKVFEGLNNKLLFELGNKLNFYDGIPEIFKKLTESVNGSAKFKRFNITLEHYIVSTGLAEMIKGSQITPFIKGIWGCEFIETPIKTCLDIKEYCVDKQVIEKQEISQIGYAIDNTSKTRAIFEINKGANLHKDIDVNSKISEEDRRVPFENMIYIADGPSDVPVFSILKQYGGKTFAVYPKGNKAAFQQVDRLIQDGRIDMYGEADYREGTATYMWLFEHTNQIAERIYQDKNDLIRASVSKPPEHLND